MALREQPNVSIFYSPCHFIHIPCIAIHVLPGWILTHTVIHSSMPFRSIRRILLRRWKVYVYYFIAWQFCRQLPSVIHFKAGGTLRLMRPDRYQGQGQIITSHKYCGILFLVPALDTCFWHTNPHICEQIEYQGVAITLVTLHGDRH